MSSEEIIIRQSRKKQFIFFLLPLILLLYYFIGPYNKTRIFYKDNSGLTIVIGLILFGFLVFNFLEIIKKKAEITLSTKGIEFRDKGFFSWEFVRSFKTILYKYEDFDDEYLEMHFEGFKTIKFNISHLEKKKEEIVELILKYKKSNHVMYLGHEIK